MFAKLGSRNAKETMAKERESCIMVFMTGSKRGAVGFDAKNLVTQRAQKRGV